MNKWSDFKDKVLFWFFLVFIWWVASLLLLIALRESGLDHKPSGLDLFYIFGSISMFFFNIYYVVKNIKVFIYRTKAGAQREIQETEADKKLRTAGQP